MTLACVAVGWLAWQYGGEAADWLGLWEFDPLPRVIAAFAVLGLLERLLARLPAATQKQGTTDAH